MKDGIQKGGEVIVQDVDDESRSTRRLHKAIKRGT
jgi:hypothetical protein